MLNPKIQSSSNEARSVMHSSDKGFVYILTNESGAYQGAKYFSYKGKVLNDLRDEIEGK